MKIHYCSDPHIDFYTSDPTEHAMKKFFDSYIATSGEVLVIAGDISHYNTQLVNFLTVCSKYFNKVFFVTGNHEFYNISKTQKARYPTLHSKVTELASKIDNPNIHLLDGNSITYNGIKFAGTMGWYDGSYYYSIASPYSPSILSVWKSYTNDSNKIPQLPTFLDLWEIEKPKILSAVATEPDVMITHFCPTILPSFVDKRHVDDLSTAFYCFDGLQYLNNIKYWVYGHMHSEHIGTYNSTTLLRNPLGYPREVPSYKIQSFEI